MCSCQHCLLKVLKKKQHDKQKYTKLREKLNNIRSQETLPLSLPLRKYLWMLRTFQFILEEQKNSCVVKPMKSWALVEPVNESE